VGAFCRKCGSQVRATTAADGRTKLRLTCPVGHKSKHLKDIGYAVAEGPAPREHRSGAADLRERGVEMVFLTIGEVEENHALLDEHGLEPRVLVMDPAENEVFPGIGTPSAYLVDEEGKAASELQVGANMVPDLARSAAGRA
jgi:hypothetical protein